ncbi:MAG: 3-hydroxyacyl-ACP dehydratase FabZ [Acidobacteriota bacterium]|jgi:3-hydroxyacyl-[acyl-carrier-protein] dehydratase
MTGMEIGEILEALPERYPLLLVDRVLELKPGKRGVGLKNVTINEEFFQGHFPGHPVMPGVLILEAMGQVGRLAMGEAAASRVRTVQRARFRRPVVPGDTLRLEVDVEGPDPEGRWTLTGRARVGDAAVAEATLIAVRDGEGA